ncbi:MAG: CRTAC1 family protein [Gammaproteobacteria bacterium]|nr:CRTAC1 family protein [Gammaproteobacteria bacterium]
MTEPGEDPGHSDGEDRIRRALQASLIAVAAIAVVAVATFWLTSRRSADDAPAEHRPAGPDAPQKDVSSRLPTLVFTDTTKEAGIDFIHETGAYGERLLPETMGGGVAFFDYDNDGDPDLLFVNSATWPWRAQPATPATSKLYRNRGDGTFEDVSAATGMDVVLYGMGVATGDYDGDGFVDVFVTAVGENRLFRNVGGDRFVDVTAETGVAGDPDAWSTSAAFVDIDGDGDLDLFACNYVAWSPEIDREVDYRLTGIGRAYGPPTDFPGTDSYLYRNDDGRFVEISEVAGVHVANASTGQPVGKALAVLPVDVDGDRRTDLVVANDTVRNFLFLNQGDGRFREAGVDMGLAFDASGAATGAMGVDAGHYDNDDKLAVVIGNFANEMSSFYVARPGEGLFSDDAIVSGVGAASRRALTFGVFLFDADLDGRLDVLAANGHVEPEIRRVQASQSYAQPIQLFWNCGTDCARRYELLDRVGDLAAPIVGRGAAYADIDDDGDLDVAITQVGGRAVLLRNDQALGHNWVRVKLASASNNRHALGAVVTAAAAGHRQVRVVNPARSYLSQVELPVTIGLGDAPLLEELTVDWPGGAQETWTDLPSGRSYTLREGQARDP